MGRRLHTLFAVSAVVYTAASLMIPALNASADSTYGGGTYNKCEFARDCPVPPSTPAPTPSTATPIPATPESPTEPTNDLSISSNLTPDRLIDTDTVELIVWLDRTNSDRTVTRLTSSDIGWVVGYVDDKQIGVQYNPDNQNQYHIQWDVIETPGTKVTFVGYSHEAKPIQRKDVNVKLASAIVKRAEARRIANNDQAPSGNTSEQPTAATRKRIILSPATEAAARSLPYWLLLILLLIALRLWWQSVSEIRATNQIRRLIATERMILGQKQEFLSIISHYLRTPLTTLQGGVELIGVPSATNAPLNALSQASLQLGTVVSGLVAQTEQNSNAQVAEAGDSQLLDRRPIRTSPFWLLIGLIALVVVIAQGLLAFFTTLDYSLFDIVEQLLIGVAIVIFLLLGLRQLQVKRTLRDHESHNLQLASNLDRLRNDFIRSAAQQLQFSLAKVDRAAKPFLANPAGGKFLAKGMDDFRKMIARLNVAALVSTEALDQQHAENISTNEIISRCLNDEAATIESKHLNVTVPHTDFRAFTNHGLFGFVLSAIVDNAVKFNKENGQVVIEASASSTGLHLQVKDSGNGISQDKLAKLFTPFARGTDTNTYDFEGMGFDLYLSKLIMTRLHGDLTVDSRPDNGTVASITLPATI